MSSVAKCALMQDEHQNQHELPDHAHGQENDEGLREGEGESQPDATMGAITHASTAIGTAAAAQTPITPGRVSWGIGFSVAAERALPRTDSI